MNSRELVEEVCGIVSEPIVDELYHKVDKIAEIICTKKLFCHEADALLGKTFDDNYEIKDDIALTEEDAEVLIKLKPYYEKLSKAFELLQAFIEDCEALEDRTK